MGEGALNQSKSVTVVPMASCAVGDGSRPRALSVHAPEFIPTECVRGGNTTEDCCSNPGHIDDPHVNSRGCLSAQRPSVNQGDGEYVTLTDGDAECATLSNGTEMPSTSSTSSHKEYGTVNNLEERKKEDDMLSVQCRSCPLPASTRDRSSSEPPVFQLQPAFQPLLMSCGVLSCGGMPQSLKEAFPADNGRTIWCKPREVSEHHAWKVFYDCMDERGMKSQHFVDSMCVLGSFDTMCEFSSHYGGKIHLISNNATLRVFKSNVQPVWEDPANSGPGAGKWSCFVPNKRSSVAAFQALLEAMVQGNLPCANGLVLCRRNRQHMVVVWTSSGCSSMAEQKAAIQSTLRELVPAPKLSFKSHKRAKNRNMKEEFLCLLQDGRHARTASLEVHIDLPGFADSDYSPAHSEELSPELTGNLGPSSHLRAPAMDLDSGTSGAGEQATMPEENPSLSKLEDTPLPLRRYSSFVDLLDPEHCEAHLHAEHLQPVPQEHDLDGGCGSDFSSD